MASYPASMHGLLSRGCLALLLGVMIGGLACGENEDPSVGAVGSTDTARRLEDLPSDRPSEAQWIEELSVLGYAAETERASESSGVMQHDPLRVAPGLNLITSGHAPVALLMNMQGEILHEWRAEFADVFPDHPRFERAREPTRNYWRDAVLLPNGDLLVIWELYGLFKLDRDSRVLWAVPDPVHHDLQLTEAGEIVHLQAERKTMPELPQQLAIEDFIVVRDSSGQERRRVAMSDALRNADWPRLREAFWIRSKARGYPLTNRSVYDPFHTNSLWLLTPAEAARLGEPFRAGDALVSMAMLDTIALIDMQRGVTRWWQQGPFGMQHEPRPTPEGFIVVFNNFLAADRSSVMTIDPRTRYVFREYTGPTAEPLFSKRSGRVQVLPNGNMLVVETDRGRALELTDDDSIVWEFHSPYRAGPRLDRVASLYSLERVGESQVSWLDFRH